MEALRHYLRLAPPGTCHVLPLWASACKPATALSSTTLELLMHSLWFVGAHRISVWGRSIRNVSIKLRPILSVCDGLVEVNNLRVFHIADQSGHGQSFYRGSVGAENQVGTHRTHCACRRPTMLRLKQTKKIHQCHRRCGFRGPLYLTGQGSGRAGTVDGRITQASRIRSEITDTCQEAPWTSDPPTPPCDDYIPHFRSHDSRAEC